MLSKSEIYIQLFFFFFVFFILRQTLPKLPEMALESSYFVAQKGLELGITLSQSQSSQDNRPEPLDLVGSQTFKSTQSP